MSPVACSRGREKAHIFTPDKENLINRLGMTTDRTAAADIIAKHRNGVWINDQIRANEFVRDDMYNDDYKNQYQQERQGVSI